MQCANRIRLNVRSAEAPLKKAICFASHAAKTGLITPIASSKSTMTTNSDNLPDKPKAKNRGTPIKLTPEKRGVVLGSIAAGSSLRYAAAEAGVDHSAVIQLIKRDPEFAAKYAAADAKCYRRHIDVINCSSDEDWRASAWFLERRYRDEFGKQEKIEHSGGQTIRIEFADDFFTRNKISGDEIQQVDDNATDAEFDLLEGPEGD